MDDNYYGDQIILFADFDSANMARYEKVTSNNRLLNVDNSNNATVNNINGTNSTNNISANNQQSDNVDQNKHIEHQKFDAEFNVWTRNDCQGTQYSNGNRTWFYFGVKGGHGKWVKFNIMNLNRQGRLFEMGMLPVFKTVPGHEKWSRIYSRPTWQNLENNFQMSFCFHLPDRKFTVTYFAFCFPYSYDDCQSQLAKLDQEFEYCKSISASKCDSETIYYHRELLCYSLDNRRVDLLTISGCNNTNFKREPRFDKRLFPDKNNQRPINFNKKRVFILTSRVHPGETPASFVFNGFLEFILNKDDPRAKALRKHFVFKLIPLLNPDGVSRGHYRTDQLGMNLNRVYLDPSFEFHPSIYAAKSLFVFHHIMNRTSKDQDGINFDGIFELNYDLKDEKERDEREIDLFDKITNQNNIDVDNEFEHDNESLIENSIINDLNEATRIVTPRSLLLLSASSSKRNNIALERDKIAFSQPYLSSENMNKKLENLSLNLQHDANSSTYQSQLKLQTHRMTPTSNVDINSARSNKIMLTPLNNKSIKTVNMEYEENMMNSSNSNHANLYILKNSHDKSFNELKKSSNKEGYIGNENSDDDDDNNPIFNSKVPNSPHLNDTRLTLINPLCSGVAFYVDLHGHAAKRGCFIYGNAIENESYQVENVLFAKLISLNSQHFDFEGCNFSLKNMYYKDKREGLSKEGSGRVALYKTTGIIHSYTLECNYACGRVMNTMAPAANSGMYNGRISPPQHTELPPKFLPEHYQNVGKGLAIAALDITESNPCSRVGNTTFGSLEAVRNWVKFYIRTKSNVNNKDGNNKKSINFVRSQVNNKQNANTVSNIANTATTNTSTNNENKQTIRRNTAPSNNTNNYINNENINSKKYATQLSMPNNNSAAAPSKSNNTITAFKDFRNSNTNFNETKFKQNFNNKRSFNNPEPHQSQQNNFRNVNRTPVAESKNFIRKTIPLEVQKTVGNETNKDIDEDFREFNNFINENYNDDKNSEKEGPALVNQEYSDNFINDSESIAAKQHKLTEETSWFFKDDNLNSQDILNNLEVLTTNNPDNKAAQNNENDKIFTLNKPNTRIQRLSNNISKGYNLANPVRELFPLNKANVLHNSINVENNLQQQQQQLLAITAQPQIQFAATSVPTATYKTTNTENISNTREAISNAVALAKQYMPKGITNQFYQKQPAAKKQVKPQTIKTIYNTNLIKKFLNTKKLQLGNKNEIKIITNSLMQQQQQQIQNSTSRPTTQLQMQSQTINQPNQQQDPNQDNMDSLKSKTKKILIEYKTRSTRKPVQQIPLKQMIQQPQQLIQQQNMSTNETNNITQYFENKKMRRKRFRENARKIKVSLPNIEKFDSSVKINEVDEVTAFWIDL